MRNLILLTLSIGAVLFADSVHEDPYAYPQVTAFCYQIINGKVVPVPGAEINWQTWVTNRGDHSLHAPVPSGGDFSGPQAYFSPAETTLNFVVGGGGQYAQTVSDSDGLSTLYVNLPGFNGEYHLEASSFGIEGLPKRDYEAQILTYVQYAGYPYIVLQNTYHSDPVHLNAHMYFTKLVAGSILGASQSYQKAETSASKGDVIDMYRGSLRLGGTADNDPNSVDGGWTTFAYEQHYMGTEVDVGNPYLSGRGGAFELGLLDRLMGLSGCFLGKFAPVPGTIGPVPPLSSQGFWVSSFYMHYACGQAPSVGGSPFPNVGIGLPKPPAK